MSEENNSQEFKSVSPTTTEANYKALYVVYLVQQLHLVHV